MRIRVTLLRQLSDAAIEDLADHLFALAGTTKCFTKCARHFDVLLIALRRLHFWPQQPRLHQKPLLHTHGHRAAHQATPATPNPSRLPHFVLAPLSHVSLPTLLSPSSSSAGATINQALRAVMCTSFSTKSIAWCVAARALRPSPAQSLH